MRSHSGITSSSSALCDWSAPVQFVVTMVTHVRRLCAHPWGSILAMYAIGVIAAVRAVDANITLGSQPTDPQWELRVRKARLTADEGTRVRAALGRLVTVARGGLVSCRRGTRRPLQ